MPTQSIAQVLSKYLPPPAVETCAAWVIRKNIHLKITRGRSSKYGDYRPLGAGKGHRITVNHDLNAYAFLITFVHEVAHLHCYVNHRHRHEPHGQEWKREFKLLLNEFLSDKVFPPDIEAALNNYLQDPAASSCTDPMLSRTLKKYDSHHALRVFHLEELPAGSVFKLHQSRSAQSFQKGARRRTRFHCLEIKSRHIYYISALAEVIPFEN